MAKKNGQTDPVATYGVETERLRELQSEAKMLEDRAQTLQQRIRTEETVDRTTRAAEALLGGASLEEASDYREELEEVRGRLRVVRRAAELQRERVETAKRARDAHLVEQARPKASKIAQALAEALATVGASADALEEVLDGLRTEGAVVPNEWRIRTFPLRGSQPGSRLNEMLDELEAGFGASVDRKALAATVKRERVRAEEDAERRKQHGGLISASPEGVVEWDVGGKPRVPPHERRRTRTTTADATWRH